MDVMTSWTTPSMTIDERMFYGAFERWSAEGIWEESAQNAVITGGTVVTRARAVDLLSEILRAGAMETVKLWPRSFLEAAFQRFGERAADRPLQETLLHHARTQSRDLGRGLIVKLTEIDENALPLVQQIFTTVDGGRDMPTLVRYLISGPPEVVDRVIEMRGFHAAEASILRLWSANGS